MNIAFSWTLEPLLAGLKTCTRRDWTERHMKAWQKAWDEGRRTHQAWSKSPRFGGECLGPFNLTCRPYWEWLHDMLESDLEAEGGLWPDREEFIGLFGGDKKVAVVRFEWLGDNKEEG